MSDKCATCDVVCQRVLRCGACKTAVYCSKEHQKADWKQHKTVCVPAAAAKKPADPEVDAVTNKVENIQITDRTTEQKVGSAKKSQKGQTEKPKMEKETTEKKPTAEETVEKKRPESKQEPSNSQKSKKKQDTDKDKDSARPTSNKSNGGNSSNGGSSKGNNNDSAKVSNKKDSNKKDGKNDSKKDNKDSKKDGAQKAEKKKQEEKKGKGSNKPSVAVPVVVKEEEEKKKVGTGVEEEEQEQEEEEEEEEEEDEHRAATVVDRGGDADADADGEGEGELEAGGRGEDHEADLRLEKRLIGELKALRENEGIENEATISKALELCYLWIQFYKLQPCEELTNEIFPIIKAKFDASPFEHVRLYSRAVQSKAFMQFKQFKYDEALANFEEFRRCVGGSPELCENMGHTYNRVHRYDEAEREFKESLRLLEERGEEGNKGGVLLGLGSLQNKRGKYEEGLESFEAGLAFYRNKFKTVPHSLVAKSLVTVGQTLEHLKRYEEAEKAFQEAYDIFDLTCGQNTPLTANALACLADIKLKLKKVEEAYGLMSRALALYCGFDTLDIGRISDVLGEAMDTCAEYNAYKRASKSQEEGGEMDRTPYEGLLPSVRLLLANIERQSIKDDEEGVLTMLKKKAAEICLLANELDLCETLITDALRWFRACTKVDCSQLVHFCESIIVYIYKRRTDSGPAQALAASAANAARARRGGDADDEGGEGGELDGELEAEAAAVDGEKGEVQQQQHSKPLTTSSSSAAASSKFSNLNSNSNSNSNSKPAEEKQSVVDLSGKSSGAGDEIGTGVEKEKREPLAGENWENDQIQEQNFIAILAKTRTEHGNTSDEAFHAAMDLINLWIQFYKLAPCDELIAEFFPIVKANFDSNPVKYVQNYMKLVQARAFLRFKQFRYRESLVDFLEFRRYMGASAELSENMGHLYNRMGLYKEAENEFQESLRLMNAPGALTKHNKGGVLLGLGSLLSKTGKNVEALEVLREGLQFYRTKYQGMEHSLVAKALMAVGQTLENLKLFDEAAVQFEEAYRLFDSTCGQNTPLTANALACHAHALSKLGKYREARDKIMRAFDLYAGFDTLDLQRVYEVMQSSLDIVSGVSKELDRNLYLPFVPIVKKLWENVKKQNVTEDGSGTLAVLKKGCGDLCLLAGELDMALPLTSEALEFLRTVKTVDCTHLVKTCESVIQYIHRTKEAAAAGPPAAATSTAGPAAQQKKKASNKATAEHKGKKDSKKKDSKKKESHKKEESKGGKKASNKAKAEHKGKKPSKKK